MLKNNKKKKKSTGKKKEKNVVVDRAFFLRLADQIYDPKTRKFLRLCDGELQNGPDPTDKERTMHCGLGELYFAMTGDHPRGHVREDGIIELAIKRLPKQCLDHIQDEVRDTLDEIPEANDDVSGDKYDDYRSRACHVAKKLREAAKLVA